MVDDELAEEDALRECPSCMIDRHDLCSGDCDCPYHRDEES